MVLPAFSPIAPYVVPTTMLDVVKHLGLPTPKLCLDAGDINSVASGSQTKWLDVSGNGYDFFRGSDATSQSSDPTFNGTPGGQGSPEYYSFDGGDFLTYDTSNETWMNNLHKDNAVWGVAAWIYLTDATTVQSLAATADSGADSGWQLAVSSGGPSIIVGNGTGGTAWTSSGAGLSGLNAGAWNFLAISFTENTGALAGRVNTTSVTPTMASYTSPSSAAATFTLLIGSESSSPLPPRMLASGSRLSSFLMWEGTAPTSAQITDLYNATKGKFGL